MLTHALITGLTNRPSLSVFECISQFFSRSASVLETSLKLCDPMDYMVHGILQARILGALHRRTPRLALAVSLGIWVGEFSVGVARAGGDKSSSLGSPPHTASIVHLGNGRTSVPYKGP